MIITKSSLFVLGFALLHINKQTQYKNYVLSWNVHFPLHLHLGGFFKRMFSMNVELFILCLVLRKNI